MMVHAREHCNVHAHDNMPLNFRICPNKNWINTKTIRSQSPLACRFHPDSIHFSCVLHVDFSRTHMTIHAKEHCNAHAHDNMPLPLIFPKKRNLDYTQSQSPLACRFHHDSIRFSCILRDEMSRNHMMVHPLEHCKV